MNKFSRFTERQLRHMFVDIEQNKAGSFVKQCFDSDLIDIVNSKFGNIIKLIYQRDNTVSLGMEQVLIATQSTSPDVKQFIDNWLLKELPAIPSAPDDDIAFASIIPRSIGTLSQASEYLDNLATSLQNAQTDNQPTPSPSE